VTARRNPDGDFEERLLARLKATVAERGAAAARLEAEEAATATPAWRRRGPRLAFGGGVALAAAVAALSVSAGGDDTSKAFAVEPQEGGGTTFKVYGLKEAPALEQALNDAGIPAQVTWLPTGMACREPHFTPSTIQVPGGETEGGMSVEGPSSTGFTFGVGSSQLWRERADRHMRGEMSDEKFAATVPNLNLDPAAFGPDQSVVISGAPVPFDGDPEGGFEASFEIAEGPVEPCEAVPRQPSHESILRPPPGGWKGAGDSKGADSAPSGAEAPAGAGVPGATVITPADLGG